MKRKHGLTPVQRIERHRLIKENGCWETDYDPSKTYPSIKVAGKHVFVHRIMYEHTHGPIPEGLFVLHRCDNPRCHNPEHLFLGTLADNVRDMMKKGRHRVVPRTNLTMHKHILDLAKQTPPLSQKEIADRLGCSQSAVSAVMRKNGLHRTKNSPLRKLRHPNRGEKHGRALLNKAQVLAIRASNHTQKHLAAQYQVSPQTIYAIRRRKIWAHI